MEISRLKLQLQTSLSERGVFEMRIGQLTDDVKRVEAERDKVMLAYSSHAVCLTVNLGRFIVIFKLFGIIVRPFPRRPHYVLHPICLCLSICLSHAHC